MRFWDDCSSRFSLQLEKAQNLSGQPWRSASPRPEGISGERAEPCWTASQACPLTKKSRKKCAASENKEERRMPEGCPVVQGAISRCLISVTTWRRTARSQRIGKRPWGRSRLKDGLIGEVAVPVEQQLEEKDRSEAVIWRAYTLAYVFLRRGRFRILNSLRLTSSGTFSSGTTSRYR